MLSLIPLALFVGCASTQEISAFRRSASVAESPGRELPPNLQATLDFLRGELPIDPVYPGFKLGRYPILFVDLQKDPSSGVLVRDGKIITEVRTSTPIRLANELYDVVDAQYSDGSKNAEVHQFMRQHKITNIMIWNLGFSFPRKISDQIEWGDHLFFASLAHEGFHVFAQRPDSGVVMPAEAYGGISNDAREEMQRVCMGYNEKIASIAGQERAALLRSFLAVYRDDLAGGRAAAQEFIGLRKERYAVLQDRKISDPRGWGAITCADAENRAAQVEGIADFVGVGTILSAGLRSPEAAVRYFLPVVAENASFYYFASFQLLILRKASSENLMGFLEQSHESLFAAFEHWANKNNSQSSSQ